MVESHYGAEYFAWQRQIGATGALLNQYKFLPWLKADATVLDFGCGGGALLESLPGTEKIGVEIGEPARAEAATRGITVYESTRDIASESVDIVISNHALEHVERPLEEVRELYRILRPGGIAVLVVPINDWRGERSPDPSDVNHHLYTWTPLLFANLLTDAGFKVESCRVLTHAWTRRFLPLRRTPALYEAAVRLLAVLKRRRQIHAVARKAQ